MKLALLWVYISAFFGIFVFGLIDPEARGTPGEMLLDTLLSTIALTGLIAYAIRLDAPRLIAAWRFVAPAFLAGLILQLIADWPSLMDPDPELTRTEHSVLLGIGLVAVALFLAPAVIVNFRFASARHLDASR
jgi:hypothetical protein